MAIAKPSMNTMLRAVAREYPHITPGVRDSMAIPSFLHRSPLVRWLVWRRYQVISDLCRFRNDESVLEFGCGPGFFLPELSGRGCRITALDLYPEYAKDLCSLLSIRAEFPKNLESIPDSSIDTVIAAQVLEHLEKPGEYYRQFRRVLSPGGRLIISLPTENPAYRAGRLLAGFRGKGDYHVSSAAAIIEKASKHGFTVRKKVAIPNRLLPLYLVYELK